MDPDLNELKKLTKNLHFVVHTDQDSSFSHQDLVQALVRIGPQIQVFIHLVISPVCIKRLAQGPAGDSVMGTLSPGLTYQCTLQTTQDV